MFVPTTPTDLIDAIIDQLALLSPTNKELGRMTFIYIHALLLCSHLQNLCLPSRKHIFHTIDLSAHLSRGVYFVRFHCLLVSNPYPYEAPSTRRQLRE